MGYGYLQVFHQFIIFTNEYMAFLVHFRHFWNMAEGANNKKTHIIWSCSHFSENVLFRLGASMFQLFLIFCSAHPLFVRL